jgi:hypothetical protein
MLYEANRLVNYEPLPERSWPIPLVSSLALVLLGLAALTGSGVTALF